MDSRFFAVFLTVLSTLIASPAAQARDNSWFYIDLQQFPLYIKAGFYPSDAVSPDLQDGSWQVREQKMQFFKYFFCRYIINLTCA
jgi:hypothetical protein